MNKMNKRTRGRFVPVNESKLRRTTKMIRKRRMKMIRKWLAMAAGLVLLPGASAWGADAINSGDTSWVIVSTALVMMMTLAGLALFYSGMSRYKNLLNTFAMTWSPIVWPVSSGWSGVTLWPSGRITAESSAG